MIEGLELQFKFMKVEKDEEIQALKAEVEELKQYK